MSQTRGVKGELQEEESCSEKLYFTTDYKVSYCQEGTQGLILLMANALHCIRLLEIAVF